MTQERFEKIVKDVLAKNNIWVSPEDIPEIAENALHLFCGHDFKEEENAAMMAIQKHGFVPKFKMKLKFQDGELCVTTTCQGHMKKSSVNITTVTNFPDDILYEVQNTLEEIQEDGQ